MTKQQQYSIVGVCHILFLCSSISGHLGCIHVLLIVNKVSYSLIFMNIKITSCPAFHSFGYVPRNRIARSCNSIFNFLRICHPIFHSGCTILNTFPPTVHKGLNFTNTCYFLVCFYSSHPNGCKGVKFIHHT